MQVPRTSRKTILQALILTSLFWIALDILFFLNKQAPNVDLDVVVVNRNPDWDIIKHKSSPSSRPERVEEENSLVTNKVKRQVDASIDQKDGGLGKLNVEIHPNLVIQGLGSNGRKAALPPSSYLQSLSKRLFNNHSYDSVLSDRISLDRTLPDARGNL